MPHRLTSLLFITALSSGACHDGSSVAHPPSPPMAPPEVARDAAPEPAADATPVTHAFANPDLPAEERIDDLLKSLTLEEKVECLAPTPKLPRLGLRLTGHVEGLHGLALGGPSG